MMALIINAYIIFVIILIAMLAIIGVDFKKWQGRLLFVFIFLSVFFVALLLEDWALALQKGGAIAFIFLLSSSARYRQKATQISNGNREEQAGKK